ncbi:MAG: TldD/PmbA family protein [Myxococcota bacterium]
MHDKEGAAWLNDRAQQALQFALNAGAADVWVSATRQREVDLEMREGTLEKVQEATSRGLSLRVWVGGRYGAHNTTDLRADRLESFVRSAVELTGALEPDPDRQIPDPSLFEGRSDVDLELLDPRVSELTPEQRVAWLRAMQEEVQGTPKLISANSSVSSGQGMSVAVSSNGFSGSTESSSIWLSTSLTLQDEGDKRPEGGFWAGGRHVSDLPEAAAVAKQAVQWASERVGSGKGKTANTTMIVHPRAGGRLVRGLLRPAQGGSVHQGRSMWRDRLGKAVISPRLEVIDDPLVVRGLSSRPYDNEGIAAKPLPLLRDGALHNLYLSTTYAKKLSMTPTTGSPSNQVITPGKRDLEALIGATSRGYLVTGWLGGNMDPTTGDFSYGVRGFAIENGRRAGSVGEMNITGNLLSIFERLAEVGSDPWPYGSLRSPSLVFENVQFSGVG